jgi:hypothetical protein
MHLGGGEESRTTIESILINLWIPLCIASFLLILYNWLITLMQDSSKGEVEEI